MTLTFDLWPWPFAWTSLLSLVITPANFMMIRWWEHGEKGVTDGQTDRQTDLYTVKCHYNTVQYNMIFHTPLHWLTQNINQTHKRHSISRPHRRAMDIIFIVRRAGLLLSQQDFEWRWSVPLFQCLTVLEFYFILFDLCLLITFFNFIMNYVPIVTFWIFTYHKIWILSIMFCFIWSYWIIYFLACL